MKLSKYKDFIKNENFTHHQKVSTPKFKIDDEVRVSFYESRVSRQATPYIAKILEINKEIGVNLNEYFEYKIEIIEFDREAPDFFKTDKFNKKIGEIHKVPEHSISKR